MDDEYYHFYCLRWCLCKVDADVEGDTCSGYPRILAHSGAKRTGVSSAMCTRVMILLFLFLRPLLDAAISLTVQEEEDPTMRYSQSSSVPATAKAEDDGAPADPGLHGS